MLTNGFFYRAGVATACTLSARVILIHIVIATTMHVMQAAISKVFASEAAWYVADEGIQILGEYGVFACYYCCWRRRCCSADADDMNHQRV